MKCVISKLVNYCSSPESRRGSNFGLARPFRRRMHVTRSRPCFATPRHKAFLVSRVPLLDELKGGAREQEDEREFNDRPHGGHRVIEAFSSFLWVFFLRMRRRFFGGSRRSFRDGRDGALPCGLGRQVCHPLAVVAAVRGRWHRAQRRPGA